MFGQESTLAKGRFPASYLASDRAIPGLLVNRAFSPGAYARQLRSGS
ncbi:hypothetical protein PAMC26577_11420 [Caballeronia sordidicola]|uniref:Uncharacterized protein n=1 Tax=Caballeronia sordidicola TaxID=196367 RepID=A0A242MY26_CABSO|nr:hypothetical protein PAMC26577_11420 [Caballeronia sordidicola]